MKVAEISFLRLELLQRLKNNSDRGDHPGSKDRNHRLPGKEPRRLVRMRLRSAQRIKCGGWRAAEVWKLQGVKKKNETSLSDTRIINYTNLHALNDAQQILAGN